MTDRIRRNFQRGVTLGALYAGRLWECAPLCPEIDGIAGGSFKRKDPPAIVGSGYVVESLETALWAFSRSSSFQEGALLAVNLGNDADTSGAIFGQLASAYYGIAGIPQVWRECLVQIDLIQRWPGN